MHNYDMPKDAMIVFTEIGYSTFKEKLSNGLDAVVYLCFNSDTLWFIEGITSASLKKACASHC